MNFIRWDWRYRKRIKRFRDIIKREKLNRRPIHICLCKFQKTHRENGKDTLLKILELSTFSGYVFLDWVPIAMVRGGTFTQEHIVKLRNVEDKEKILKLYRRNQ